MSQGTAVSFRGIISNVSGNGGCLISDRFMIGTSTVPSFIRCCTIILCVVNLQEKLTFTTKDSAGNRLQNLMQSKVIKDAKKRSRHRDDCLDPFAQGTHGATYSRIKDVVLYLLLLH